MRKLRPSIAFLLGVLAMQTVNISLERYQTHLKHDLEVKRLQAEDYIVVNHLFENGLEIEPCDNSSAKTYMDYKAITSTTSKQYQFIQENMTIRNGFLFDQDGYIGVALGSWFGEIGSRWVFRLSSGESIYAVKIDEKDDSHTIDGCRHYLDGSVIEFVIDSETIQIERHSNGYIAGGNFNNIPWFTGDIVSLIDKNVE